MKTLNVFGIELPIIEDLGNGHYLVAHPNGPAVATNHGLYAFTCAVPDCSDEAKMWRKAIDRYTRLSWPLVKPQFHSQETDQ